MNPAINSSKKCDISAFVSDFTKESTYILGFLWADGSISNIKNNYRISLQIQKDDMEEIKPILMQNLPWKFHTKKIKVENRKPIVDAYFGDKNFFSFLQEMNFCEKSTPEKILQLIPIDLHAYFFRGLIDGDGCFYINKKQYLYQFVLSSKINQDWEFFTDLMERLKIKYQQQSRSFFNKKGVLNSYSCIRITNKREIIKLIDFIYQNKDDNKIGLSRKYKKAFAIKMEV